MRPSSSGWSLTVTPDRLAVASSNSSRKLKKRIKIIYKGTFLKDKLDETRVDQDHLQQIVYYIQSVTEDRVEIVSHLDMKSAKLLLDSIKRSSVDIWNDIYENVENSIRLMLSPNVIVEVDCCKKKMSKYRYDIDAFLLFCCTVQKLYLTQMLHSTIP